MQIFWNLDIVGRGSRIFTVCLVGHFGAANGGSPSLAKIDSGHEAQRFLFGKIQHRNMQVESEPKTSYMMIGRLHWGWQRRKEDWRQVTSTRISCMEEDIVSTKKNCCSAHFLKV